MNQSEVAYRSVPISVSQSLGEFDDAVALYDNQSEGPDELHFKKGDVLKILERDFNGLTGWWLCALKDKIGLAPGNRLEVVGSAPEKPQTFRKKQDAALSLKGKMADDVYKQSYGLYDVPKIVFDRSPAGQQQQQQQQQDGEERRQEIPDILKGQNVQSRSTTATTATIGNNNNNNSNNHANHTLYNGPSAYGAAYPDATTAGQMDAYIWPEDLSRIPNSGKKGLPLPLSGATPSVNGTGPSVGRNAQQEVGRTNGGQKVSPPGISVSTYSNLQHPAGQIGIINGGDSQQQHQQQYQQLQQLQQQHPQQFVYRVPVNGDQSQLSRNCRKPLYSDCDNYDNLGVQATAAQIANGFRSTKANETGPTAIIATTNNNMNKLINNNSNNSNNNNNNDGKSGVRYYDLGRNVGSQTLQHKSRRPSESDRLTVRDDTALPAAGAKCAPKGKRDRSLRRVRFADQVTSSDTEEWAKNGDQQPNNGSLPLKPILSSSNQSRSSNNSNSKNGQHFSTRDSHNNNNNNYNYNDNYLSPVDDFAVRQNNQAFYQALQADVPDYENPYTEIADQPIYERPPIAYASTSSKLNADSPNTDRHAGKNFTSEYKAVLNARGGSAPTHNNNYPLQNYANGIGHTPSQSLQKKFEGVFITPLTRVENEPEFQLRFLDLPKKEQDKVPKLDDRAAKITPELLNKSREKVQILANSLDGILSRRNADDADVATMILRSMDVELQFLLVVGERGFKKAVETWSGDLIECLLQHLEDLRTLQGTLALLNRQILELSKDIGNVQYCQAFETICVSCALAGQNICRPVHQFVAYLVPKFKFLFPQSMTDIGRLAPSPTFNSSPAGSGSGYSTMTTNQLKGGRFNEGPNQSAAAANAAATLLSLPKQMPSGRVPSPIPRIESVPSYNGNNAAHYYDDLPFNGSTLRPSSAVVATPVRYEARQLHPSLPSHHSSFQGRPLPPAPPCYASVVGGQASYAPLQAAVEATRPPATGPAVQSANAARLQMARESPAFNASVNNNINGGINVFGKDDA